MAAMLNFGSTPRITKAADEVYIFAKPLSILAKYCQKGVYRLRRRWMQIMRNVDVMPV